MCESLHIWYNWLALLFFKTNLVICKTMIKLVYIHHDFIREQISADGIKLVIVQLNNGNGT